MCGNETLFSLEKSNARRTYLHTQSIAPRNMIKYISNQETFNLGEYSKGVQTLPSHVTTHGALNVFLIGGIGHPKNCLRSNVLELPSEWATSLNRFKNCALPQSTNCSITKGDHLIRSTCVMQTNICFGLFSLEKSNARRTAERVKRMNLTAESRTGVFISRRS